MNDTVLTIDLGTSGPKVALVSVQGAIAAWEAEPTTLHLLPGGGAEQDPAEWWTAITRAAQRLMTRQVVRPDDIIAVSVTGQWAGTVPVDAGGQPLARAIIWMDARGAPHVGRVVGGPVAGYRPDRLAAWLRLTGGVPGLAGKDSIAHILYLEREQPALYRQAARFLEPVDYLSLRLTGQAASTPNVIALHWLTDNRAIDRVDYHPRLLAWTGVARDKLPPLRPPATILGGLTPDAADALGLPAGLPVVMATPDIHSAAVGSGAVQDFAAHLYIGTSSWLVCHVPGKKTDLLHNMAALPSAIPGRYLLTNEQECAGVCLTFLRDNLLFPDDELATPRPADVYPTLDRMAARVAPGSGGVLFTPWLYGERTPVEDHTVRGGFHNLALHTTRADLARAVLEGVAFNTRWLLEAVEGFTRRRLDTVRFIGGGAQSAVWSQILADVLDRPLAQMADPVQANARGAAFQAAVALRRMTFGDAAQRAPVAQTFHPTPDHRRVYDPLYREFRQVYQRNKDIYRRLNRPAV